MPVEKNIGDPVVISVTITNIGSDAYFSIDFALNGTVISSIPEYPMPAGQTGTTGLPFFAQQAGTFDVTVTVNHNGNVMDSKTLPGELIVREAPVYAAQIVSVMVS